MQSVHCLLRLRHGDSEVHRLPAAGVTRRADVQSIVDPRRRTDEVDGELGQRSVGDVDVRVEYHRRRRARHTCTVLPQSDACRSLDEHAAADARRTRGPHEHLRQ